MTISYMIVVIIPLIVVSVFLYFRFYDIVVKNTAASEQTLSVQTSNTLKATINQVEYAAKSISENRVTQELFSKGSNASLDLSVNNQKIENYYETILSMIDEELITDIRVYYDTPFSQLNECNTEEISVFEPIENIMSTYWYGIFSTTDTSELFCPSLYLSPSEARENGELAYITRINYENETGDAAFIAVYFSKDRIQNILSQNITVNDSAAYIINEKSTLIAASDIALTGAYFTGIDEIKELAQTENNFVTAPFMQENLYVGYHKMNNSDWYMISVIPSNNVMQKGRLLIFEVWGFYLAFAVLAFILAYQLSGSIARRISTVVHQMEKVHFKRPERIGESVNADDEVGELIHTYNYMTDEINSLMEDQERAAKELRLSEFAALQAQINPHFLYNSLDMINWLTQKGEKEEAGKAIQALSKFYKLTLSKKSTVGTMEVELEHVSLYVKLQNMRYDDGIDLVIDIPPDMLPCSIPRLTFQPIIENAILHGVMMKPEKQGTIVITGWREGEDLIFLVSDDGVGMDEGTLSKILSGEGKSRKGTNIGVYNTHRRLQLIYGEVYGLSYESSTDKGTEVFIRIPENGADYEAYKNK